MAGLLTGPSHGATLRLSDRKFHTSLEVSGSCHQVWSPLTLRSSTVFRQLLKRSRSAIGPFCSAEGHVTSVAIKVTTDHIANGKIPGLMVSSGFILHHVVIDTMHDEGVHGRINTVDLYWL